MLLKDYIQNFLTYLADQRRYSERTVDTYRKSFEKFFAIVGEDAPLGAFSDMQLKTFVWDLKMRQKLAPTSICEHLAAMKSFGKYLVKSKTIEKNPAGNIPMPKRPKRLVNVLSQKDLAEERFPELPADATLPQVRARILLELIYGSGLRISECQMLTWDRIDTSAKLVRVLGKGNKERIVPLTESFIDRIENYNVFNKKENDAVRAAIAETAGCDDEQAEKIRSGIMSVMSGEAKHQIPKAIFGVIALAALILLGVKLIKGWR